MNDQRFSGLIVAVQILASGCRAHPTSAAHPLPAADNPRASARRLAERVAHAWRWPRRAFARGEATPVGCRGCLRRFRVRVFAAFRPVVFEALVAAPLPAGISIFVGLSCRMLHAARSPCACSACLYSRSSRLDTADLARAVNMGAAVRLQIHTDDLDDANPGDVRRQQIDLGAYQIRYLERLLAWQIDI